MSLGNFSKNAKSGIVRTFTIFGILAFNVNASKYGKKVELNMRS